MQVEREVVYRQESCGTGINRAESAGYEQKAKRLRGCERSEQKPTELKARDASCPKGKKDGR